MHEAAVDRLCANACDRHVPLFVTRGGIVELHWEEPPRPQASFGLIDRWVTITEEGRDANGTLLIPFKPERLGWIQRETLRAFHFDGARKAFRKIAAARMHQKHPVVYFKPVGSGMYGLIGLHGHALVRQTIQLLCELKPIARPLPDRARMTLRDRVCEVVLCARDMEPLWTPKEGGPGPLPRVAIPGETICDRCRGVDILELPECHILKEQADSDESPLGAGDFGAGFRVLSDVPVSSALEGLSVSFGDVEFSTPPFNTAVVFYPASVDGANVPIADGPFPLIVVGHAKRVPGTLEPIDTTHDFQQLSGILSHLARWGFVSIAPDLSWLVNHLGSFQQIALEDAGRHMASENARAGSPFEGRIRTSRMSVMGHSAGGLAAILVGASGVLPIEAMALIAPAASQLTPADVGEFAPRPILVLHGTADTGAFGTGDQPLNVFAAAGASKHLVSIGGANHFGYTDSIHGAQDPAILSQADQQRIATAFLTAFFGRYLRGMTAFSQYLNGERTIEGLEAFEVTVEAEV